MIGYELGVVPAERGVIVLTCFIKHDGTLQPLVVAFSGMTYVAQTTRGLVVAQSQQV